MIGFCVAITLPEVVYANTGIPTIAIYYPYFLALFIPIVLIEAFIIARRLTQPFIKALVFVGAGNALSTLAGIPIAWAGLVVIQLITGGGGALDTDTTLDKLFVVIRQAPWMLEYQGTPTTLYNVAAFIMLVPSFIASYWVEVFTYCGLRQMPKSKLIGNAFLVANLVSYALLISVMLAFIGGR